MSTSRQKIIEDINNLVNEIYNVRALMYIRSFTKGMIKSLEKKKNKEINYYDK